MAIYNNPNCGPSLVYMILPYGIALFIIKYILIVVIMVRNLLMKNQLEILKIALM
jgi:hypothetical protein